MRFAKKQTLLSPTRPRQAKRTVAGTVCGLTARDVATFSGPARLSAMPMASGKRVLAMIVLLASGCSFGPGGIESQRQLEPADFAAVSPPPPPSPPAVEEPPDTEPTIGQYATASVGNHLRAATDGEADQASGPTPTQRVNGVNHRFAVDAMVGQVNGQPIYANAVFEPIIEQLTALGSNLLPGDFRQRARQLIESRLAQIVADSLILGEAESDLSAQEQAGLQNILKEQREELIRFWGIGSVALAEANLVRQTSRSLEQTLTESRQRLLVQRYLRQKLFPKINVTRKDIERYYNDHFDQFNPPPTRTLRLISVQDPSAAGRVNQLLNDGTAFEDVAALAINQYRPDEKGLMSKQAMGDQVFSQPQLNEAMLGLRASQHSPPIQIGDKTWWISVDSIEQPHGQPLIAVQLEIEQLLRRQQFQALTQQYRQELFATGSYNPIDSMSDALLMVAMSRFALTP